MLNIQINLEVSKFRSDWRVNVKHSKDPLSEREETDLNKGSSNKSM